MTISYEDLRAAIAGRSVGIRSRTELEPLGGDGDKLFPPTYGVADSAETKYATEQRRVEGNVVDAVVLDSVSSQANRQELALLGAKERSELAVPVIKLDFSGTDAVDLDVITSLEAPHRVFDALFRDSLLDGVLFRLSESGRALTEATSKNAAAVYRLAPTALLFGAWDSTGPKGGRGAKYERAITSEIVATGITIGVKTSSRLDPLGVELSAGPVFKAADTDAGWTLDANEAVQEKGIPQPYGKGGDRGRPSQINHGNVTPSIDAKAGGVTADQVTATSVLSFAQLRRLRFPLDADGAALEGDRRTEAEVAARTALAALGLAAIVLAADDGFDLRSRCVLVASSDHRFELIGRNTSEISEFSLTSEEAVALVAQAASAAADAGMPWPEADLTLTPTPRLVELVRRSHAAAAGDDEVA